MPSASRAPVPRLQRPSASTATRVRHMCILQKYPRTRKRHGGCAVAQFMLGLLIRYLAVLNAENRRQGNYSDFQADLLITVICTGLGRPVVSIIDAARSVEVVVGRATVEFVAASISMILVRGVNLVCLVSAVVQQTSPNPVMTTSWLLEVRFQELEG